MLIDEYGDLELGCERLEACLAKTSSSENRSIKNYFVAGLDNPSREVPLGYDRKRMARGRVGGFGDLSTQDRQLCFCLVIDATFGI